MRKVIVSEFVSLDGVIEDPGGAEGFKHGGWSFQFSSADQQQFKVEELFKADALLLGRRTYQGFAAAWPTMPGTGAYGERMNSLPKYVVSTTLSEVTWNATLIKGDLAEELPRLKQEGRRHSNWSRARRFLLASWCSPICPPGISTVSIDLLVALSTRKGKKMSDHPICHIEIPAPDPAAAGKFYAELFGWKIETDPALDYHMFQPQRGPGGAFVQVGEMTGARIGQVLMYVSTDDIDATLAHAEALGAKTLMPKTEGPYGWSAVFADPAGNRIALYTEPSHSS